MISSDSIPYETGSIDLVLMYTGYTMDANRREGGGPNYGPLSPVDMKPDASLLASSPTSPSSLPTTSYHNYNPVGSPPTPQVQCFMRTVLLGLVSTDNYMDHGQARICK